MCDKVVHHGPWQLKDVPYHLKIEEMYKELLKNPCHQGHVPEKYKTEEMSMKAKWIPPYELKLIPDNFLRNL